MSVHAAGVLGLIVIFIIGTLRPVNLGVLALVATFLLGTFVVGEAARQIPAGFPIDLFVLLTGVTYLFGVAVRNGTVAWIVDASVRRAGDRRRLVPWIVFALAAAPAMAGALGSTGVALLAPLAMRVAERCEIDRRLMGLMVVHGAAAGNFSPLNVLGALVHDAVTTRGLTMSVWTLFAGNLVANLILAVVLMLVFGGRRPFRAPAAGSGVSAAPAPETMPVPARLGLDQVCTLIALGVVAAISLGFGLSIGFLAFAAGAMLQLAFPRSSEGAERHIAWGVVLLVCRDRGHGHPARRRVSSVRRWRGHVGVRLERGHSRRHDSARRAAHDDGCHRHDGTGHGTGTLGDAR
jgi:hypothetical protein